VELASFCIEAAVPGKRRPPGDPKQDELWLSSGDQLFGQVTDAGPRGVTLKGRFGERRCGWAELRGWYARREAPKAAALTGGPLVRLELASGARPAPDLLDGALLELGDKKVKLKHAELGEVAVAREQVLAVRPIAAGAATR
jgi:hypothetical protein